MVIKLDELKTADKVIKILQANDKVDLRYI